MRQPRFIILYCICFAGFLPFRCFVGNFDLSDNLYVCVANNPLLHLDRKPESVNTDSNDSEKEPLDVVAEELSAVAVKCELSAVYNGMLCIPFFLKAYCPGSAETQSKENEKKLQNANSYHTQKTACEF